VNKKGHGGFTKDNVDDALFIPWNQVLIAAKLVGRSLGGDTSVSIQLGQNGTNKSKKLWPVWGDLALYRKRDGNTNMESLGVLTNVKMPTVKKAVELMNKYKDSIPWNRYVQWAAGKNGSYDGALVDESNKKPRPEDKSEEPYYSNKTDPQDAGYRNYYDVLAWCFADRVHAEFKSIKEGAQRTGDTATVNKFNDYLTGDPVWNIEQRT